MNFNIDYHEEVFASYTQKFLDAEYEQKNMLELKVAHTHRVVQHMRALVTQESCLAPHARACLLSALYHDVARFLQFSRWRTFKDSQSVNHGLLGAKVLKKQGWLQCEDAHVRRAVLTSVAMHNRYNLPQGMKDPLRLICMAVRDADKLDILRIMAEHFTASADSDSAVVFYAKDEPHSWSPAIVQAVCENRLASYNDIIYVNDFKILLCSWFHNIHFTSTRKALVRAGHLQCIMESIDENLGDVSQIAHMLAYMRILLRKEKDTLAGGEL